jgi:hypothetical protein
MNARWARRSSVAVTLVASALVGCSPAQPTAEPSSTPSLLPATCRVTEPTQGCLTDIGSLLEREAVRQAKGGAVTRHHFSGAVDAVTRDLQLAAATFSYSRDATDDDVAPTAPMKTTWMVEGVRRSFWACFRGRDVEVTSSNCTR